MLEVIPKILIISLIAGLTAQGIKILIKSTKNGKFNVKSVDDYGGMPSSHSAFLISLLTAIGLQEGVLSTAFAVTFIIATLLIRDAVGIRMELEQQGKFLKKVAEVQQPKLKIANGIGNRIGHTYPEVIVGGAIGFALALILYYFL
ncbi:MAG: divergent PAP2 family protein [Parcubacteria group bacterium]